MKKLLLLALLMLTLSASAESFWFKTESLALKTPGKEWSQWYPEVMDVVLDFDKQQFVVYSYSEQVLDYVDLTSTKYKDFVLLEARCTDTNYNVCTVQIFVYTSGNVYLKIIYSNIQYKYKLIEHTEWT